MKANAHTHPSLLLSVRATEGYSALFLIFRSAEQKIQQEAGLALLFIFSYTVKKIESTLPPSVNLTYYKVFVNQVSEKSACFSNNCQIRISQNISNRLNIAINKPQAADFLLPGQQF